MSAPDILGPEISLILKIGDVRNRITNLAIAYVDLKSNLTAAKRTRNALKCGEQEPWDSDTGNTGTGPCYVEHGEKIEDYCENCRARQAIHIECGLISKHATETHRQLKKLVAELKSL